MTVPAVQPAAPDTRPPWRLDRWTIAATLYAVMVTTGFASVYIIRVYDRRGSGMSWGQALLWQGTIWLSWGLMVPVIAWLVHRVPLAPGRLRRALPLHALACVGLVGVHALLATLLSWAFMPNNAGTLLTGRFLAVMYVGRLPVDLLLYMATVGALVAAEQWREARRRERMASEMATQLANAQLHALRAQLQPHFLFNALQAIASLIRTEPETARRMVIRLGDLLRASLQRPGTPTVPLRDELALLEHYLEIEAIRFRDRLQVAWQVEPEALDHLVPDLVLQPLAENAVRHGIGAVPEGGTLTIGARLTSGRLVLTVTDDGGGLATTPETAGTGVGLSTTRARVERLFDGTGTLSIAPAPGGRGVQVRVDLPAVRAGALPA